MSGKKQRPTKVPHLQIAITGTTSIMAKSSTTSKTRIEIGGVEVVLLPELRKGRLSDQALRSAVTKGLAAKKSTASK